MAYKVFDDYTGNFKQTDNGDTRLSATTDSGKVDLPDAEFVRDADISREGTDLILQTDNGTIIIEGYFIAEPAPDLVAPDGTMLTPDLVTSFTRGGNEYASSNLQTNDASPVGAIQEISGEATITRLDGTVETVGIGTPVYQGDIIETDENGAVNIMFVDETTFAVSEDARLAVDEYVFDPTTQSGTSNFSVLKGVFVFTSGLIGRDDPDDVMIETPSGSIGIRGTIIAGDVDTGEITVIEGAIVLTDYAGNTITLAEQYETAKFDTSENNIEHMGSLGAEEVSSKFMSVSSVAADLFSSIQDSANENNEEPQSESIPSENGQENNQKDSANTDGKENQNTEAGEKEPITTQEITGDIQTEETETEAQENIETQEQSSANDLPEQTETIEGPRIVQQETPFSISATPITVGEGIAGANVAVITGNFTHLTNLSLIGTANNFYEIERIDNNNLLIKLQSGVSMDAERPYNLTFAATNANGGARIERNFDLDVRNTIDDATRYIGTLPNTGGTISNAYAGSENSTFSYNFGQDFIDPEGDITGFQFIESGSNPDIILSSLTFDNQTGDLSFQVDGAVANGQYDFIIRALSTSGNVDLNVTYDIWAPTTSSATIFTGNQVYAGTDANIFILANDAQVFTDSGVQDNTIDVNGLNAQIKAGEGDDTFNLNAGSIGYNAFGDQGDDTFNMGEAGGRAYGGDGRDTFNLTNTASVATLESAGTGITIDGGAHFDTLELSMAGNIDFTAINDAFIQNIENIKTENSETNIVTLSYADVVEMTDEDNVLRIETDGNDSVTFVNNNANGNLFYQVGTQTHNGDSYNVFSDGIVTLLVDTDTNNVTGIV